MTGRGARQGKEKRRQRINTVAVLLLVLPFVVALVYPLLVALVGSLKGSTELLTHPLSLVPRKLTLSAWGTLFSAAPSGRMFANSVIVSSIGTVINVVITTPAAYAFARREFRGRNLLYRSVISTMMFPLAVYLVPLYLIISHLHLLNSYLAMALPISESVFGVFLLTQFFQTIPREFEDSALIDGCNEYQAFFYVFLPLARAGITTLAILTFVWKWNMYLWPLIVVSKSSLYPLTVGISVTFGSYISQSNALLAGAALIALPILIAYIFLQRYIINANVMSGLK